MPKSINILSETIVVDCGTVFNFSSFTDQSILMAKGDGGGEIFAAPITESLPSHDKVSI